MKSKKSVRPAKAVRSAEWKIWTTTEWDHINFAILKTKKTKK